MRKMRWSVRHAARLGQDALMNAEVWQILAAFAGRRDGFLGLISTAFSLSSYGGDSLFDRDRGAFEQILQFCGLTRLRTSFPRSRRATIGAIKAGIFIFGVSGIFCISACDRHRCGPHVLPDSSAPATPSTTGPKVDPGASKTPQYLERAFQGVQYFVQANDQSNAREALHRGVPRVHNGCLFVGESVVIWRPQTEHKIKDFIADILAGKAENISLGGGRALFD